MTAHRTAAFPGFTADRALGAPRRSYPARRGAAGSPSAATIAVQDATVQTKCPDGTWHDCPIRCPSGGGCYYDCTSACPSGGADAGAPRMLER